MKSKVVLLVCVLSLATLSFGDVLVGSYQFEGADAWGHSGTIVEGPGATTPTHSLQVVGGGWGPSWEMYVNGTSGKDAMAQGGYITVDITTVASDFPEEWGSVGLMINAGGEASSTWNVYDWQDLTIGTTQTLTFQFPADVQAAIPGYDWWCNFGLLASMPGAIAEELDPITGEVITPGMTPAFYSDNVQIFVPEPATMALLGLGALVLRRKK